MPPAGSERRAGIVARTTGEEWGANVNTERARQEKRQARVRRRERREVRGGSGEEGSRERREF
eukprot:749481-Hanusia_phi.AAC.25